MFPTQSRLFLIILSTLDPSLKHYPHSCRLRGRDCSNYQIGISIISVDRLPDADRKWMLSAEQSDIAYLF